MRDFRGKVVVITGAGSGIGRATARAFATQGARVHAVDISAERVAEVEAELKALGASATGHVVDCTDAEAMERLAEEVFRAEGRVDVLHNNAGVCNGTPVERADLAEWRRTVEVNLWGVIHGVVAFVPRMIAQGGGGHIVNTASMAGLVGFPYVTPYTVSKFGVVGLSEAMAPELAGHGIHVTAICPGAVRTNVMRDGHLDLPGGAGPLLVRLLDRGGPDPESVARDILAAVRSKRSLVITAAGFILPLWLLKRLSSAVYYPLARMVFSRIAAWADRSADTAR